MSFNIDFSDAGPLADIYEQNLLDPYEYKNHKTSLFANIALEIRLLPPRNEIVNVKKINNPHLYGMYLLCKEELKINKSYIMKERYLYHVTSPKNAECIAANNIDWRKTIRSRFGKGACFSKSIQYAHKHAGFKGAVIVFKVLMMKIQLVSVCYDLEVPRALSCDTTLSTNGKVYVKYDDNYFYPEYIIYY